MSRATRARAVARCRVTDSASSLHQTTNAPMRAWASTMTRAATEARRTSRSWPVRQAATTRTAISTKVAAIVTTARRRNRVNVSSWAQPRRRVGNAALVYRALADHGTAALGGPWGERAPPTWIGDRGLVTYCGR